MTVNLTHWMVSLIIYVHIRTCHGCAWIEFTRCFKQTTDPYTPYWPGADAVDWLGLSVYQYHTNSTSISDYLNANVAVGPCFIQDYIQGTLNCQPRSSTPSNRAFYTNFAEKYNKPFALPESGTEYALNATNVVPQTVDEVTMKRDWITSLLGLSPGAAGTPVFPLLKMVVNFEVSTWCVLPYNERGG